MQNTKKILYSLYAAGTVLTASMLSGCTSVYFPQSERQDSTTTQNEAGVRTGEILSGILMGIGQGLSAL